MTAQTQPIVLTVSELTQAIKLQLESTFPRVWVKGEVSNLKLQSSGHLYFSLKDEHSQIPCACFKADLSKVALLPKDGDQIMVRAEMNVWLPKGAYQLVVKELMHVGRGEQYMLLEKLKAKLQKLGYFEQARKRPIPRFPKTIGIVTSPTGAVIQDILNILTRRMVGFHVILNPVKVQGEGADLEIAQAICDFNRYKLADVLIVCRGGGSFEDLMPFNSERVATAIFQSEIPIVSAVGHETDFSVCDFVADLRAPTPSAAAEIISHEQEELLARLGQAKRLITQSIIKQMREARAALAKLCRHPLLSASENVLRSRMQLVDDIEGRLDSAIKLYMQAKRQDLNRLKKSTESVRPSNRIVQRRQELLQFEKGLNQAIQRHVRIKKSELVQKSAALDRKAQELVTLKKRAFYSFQFSRELPELVQKELFLKRRNLENVKAQLELLHPKRILAKGYTILFSQKDGSVISSVSALTSGQEVKLAFVDGEAAATITTIREKHDTTKS